MTNSLYPPSQQMSNKPHSKKFLLTLLVTLIGLNAGNMNLADIASAEPITRIPSNSEIQITDSESAVLRQGKSEPRESYEVRHKQATSQTLAKVTQTKVKVFFPRNPNIEEDFTKVESVFRTTSNPNLARFVIEQLIAGPTIQEKNKGLIGTIKLTGNSNCGSDFSLSINKQVARLRFCKTFIYGGVGDVARTKSSINATLKQFSTVKSVVILDKNGNCWADESGENLCLRQAKN